MGKRLLIIFFGAILLNGTTELHQLLKIPFLIKHFMHHRNESSSLSFLDFLKLHYTDKTHPGDNDDREDNQLPFKPDGTIFHIDTPLMTKKEIADLDNHLPQKSVTGYPEGIPCHISFSVFHPPRTV